MSYIYICHHCLRWWLGVCSSPSHYLNQWWLIVNCTFRNKIQINLTKLSDWRKYIQNVVWKRPATLFRAPCVKHTEDETRWLTFCRRHFQMHFLEWRISTDISLKFAPTGPIDNISALVKSWFWRRPSDMLLSETMMVSFQTHICVTLPQCVKRHPVLRCTVIYFDVQLLHMALCNKCRSGMPWLVINSNIMPTLQPSSPHRIIYYHFTCWTVFLYHYAFAIISRHWDNTSS